MDLLLTEIKQRIVEEQGVSAIVYLQSNNILKSILKDSKQYKWIDGKKDGSIKYQYTNNIIEVYYTIYYIDRGQNVPIIFNPGSKCSSTNASTLFPIAILLIIIPAHHPLLAQ